MNFLNINYSFRLFGFVFCIIIFSINAYAETPALVINFEPRDAVIYKGWEATADYSMIRRWAQNRNLQLLDDRQPLVDKKAAFVSKLGSTVEISSLNPNAHYRLFIDFVSFSGGSGGIVSRLVISGDGEKLAELNFGDQNGPEPYVLEIPRNLIFDGKVVLSFDEYATTYGVWGIWDMILTDGELPKTIEYKKELPVIKDSAGKAPVAPKGKKTEKVQTKTPIETPAPKENKDVKDVIEPTINPVPDTKSPDPAKTEPPKLPESPKTVEPKAPDADIRVENPPEKK
jgi:hypothetical protein